MPKKPQAMDYAEFKRQVDAFKELLCNAQKGHIELLILDLINEHSPKFMHYKAMEMIEEGDFDDDLSVRGYFKRLLYKEVIKEEEQANSVVIFKTDEEIIEELNKSTFLEANPNFMPMKPGATQDFFDKQMEQIMTSVVEHPDPQDFQNNY
jgi:hypothetical protein|nr:MAG: hypothetical protein [Lake Baikal virophage 4]